MILDKIYLSLLILIVFSAYSMNKNDEEFCEENLYDLLQEFDPMDVDSDTQTTTTSADSANFDLLSGLTCDINEAYRAQGNQNAQNLSINLELQTQTNPENIEETNQADLDQEITDFPNQNAADFNTEPNSISKKRKTSSQTQQQKRFKCNVEGCNKSYQYASGLSSHKRGRHGAGYKCRLKGCNKTFTNPQALIDHQINFHNTGYKCDKCDNVYYHQASLYNHKKIHGKGFKCRIANCSKIFSTIYQLRKHKKTCRSTDEIEISAEIIHENDNIEKLTNPNVEEQVTKKSKINESENTANIQSTNNSSNINDIANISKESSVKEIEIQEDKSDKIESLFLETDQDNNSNLLNTNTQEKEPTGKLESQTQTKNLDTKIMSKKLSDTHFEMEALKGSIIVLNQMLKNEINNTTKIGIKQMLVLIKNKFGNTRILQLLANSEDKHINLIRLTLETCVAKLQKIYTESDEVSKLATEIKTLINSNITSIIIND